MHKQTGKTSLKKWGENLVFRVNTLKNSNIQMSTKKVIKYTENQEKMIHHKRQNNAIEILNEEDNALHIPDKNFLKTVSKLLKETKENTKN